MKPLCLVILLLFTGLCCFAQPAPVVADTSYIASYTKQLTTRLYYSQKYSTIVIRDAASGPSLNYHPNSSNNLGVGATYKGFTLNLAYGFAFLNNTKSRGKTSYLDLQSHVYRRMLLVDFWGQNYKGYYLKGHEDSPYFIRPDATLYEYGLFGQYIFNGRKYSHRAAFVQDEWQIKSAGTWLAGAQAYYSLAKADSSLNIYNVQQAPIRITNIQFGPTGGYAYTLVVKKHFFATASLSLGANIGYNDSFDGTSSSYGWDIVPSLFARFSLGYNSEKWAVNAMFVNDGIRLGNKDEINAGLNSGNYRLTLTRRFELHVKTNNKLLKKVFAE